MSKKLIQAAAGAGGEAVYVEDVFSTYLYEGNSSTQTITNGIDLSGEGGLVWGKSRTDAFSNMLIDTERGGGKGLVSDATSSEYSNSTMITSFNSDGFSLGSYLGLNYSGSDIVSWTFRKQAGFFDVITWTGDGSSTRTLSHNLDANIGAVLIKGLNESEGWVVAHRSTSAGNKVLQLNTTSAETTANHTFISGSTLTVGTAGNPSFSTNDSGINYVAYLFAHDDQSFGDNSDESVIKCGSYTGDGGAGTTEVNLGFEPQWILVKATSAADNWFIIDNMRGWATESNTSNDAYLLPNASNAESTGGFLDITATGFKTTLFSNVNVSGRTYAYVAIRRPMKTPEAGTDVFAIDQPDSSSEPKYRASFPVDMAWFRTNITSTQNTNITNRLTGKGNLILNATTAEADENAHQWDYMNGWFADQGTETNNRSWMLKRAAGFFDVVAYKGDGTSSGRNINHNLKAVPELMIVKCRSASDAWMVYSSATGNTKYLTLNTTAAEATSSLRWNNTTPTDSVFTVGGSGTVNSNGETYIAYLFATVNGVSKVGSYSGTGSSQNIDCGFSAGARFVAIKRTDSSGDWYYWDSNRGIVAGNDPYLLWNSTSPQVTNTDYIDPLNSGFTISTSTSALNSSSGTYIFLAIA